MCLSVCARSCVCAHLLQEGENMQVKLNMSILEVPGGGGEG